MRYSKIRLHPLTLAVVLAQSCLVAQAQAADSADQNIEEVLVQASPIRDSQLAAIAAKRNAVNAVDIVASDTIGRFPDQNLADSLARVPGVAVERDQGQARYINLRGTPFRYTSLAFDGIDINGADDGRVPRFDSFPSVITSRIDVNKAILASMPGESVAGFINIHTFNPFDKAGPAFSLDVGQGEQNLGGGDITKYSVRGSYSGDHWGAMVFASENSREQITDNRELGMDIASDGQLIVEDIDFRSYEVKRGDAAQGATVEYRGDGAVARVFLTGLHSEFTDTEARNQFAFSLEDAVGTTGENIALGVTRMLQHGEYETSTDTITLGADFAVADWDVEARINQTATEANMYLPIIRGGGSATGSYDLSNPEDPLLYLDAPLSEVQYPRNIDMRVSQNLGIDSQKIKLDVSREFSFAGFEHELQFGIQTDTRESDGYTMSQSLDSSKFVAVDVDAFDTGVLWSSNTTNTIGGTIYDNKALRDAWEAHPDWQSVAPNANDQIVIDETINALYVMNTTQFDWGNLVLGVRNEHTDYKSLGQTGNAERDFSHLLPSAHLNVDISDNQKWRLSYTSSVTRPAYTDWRATISESPLSRTITEGNPNLKAEESSGFDTAYEWYFASASLASVGAFVRHIDNVIYTDSTRLENNWSHNIAANGSDGMIQGLEVNLQSSFDDILPAAFEGLGMSANATWLDSEFKTLAGDTLGLPGTSDSIYNASVYYERFGFSARVNYQYRDQWISPVEDPSEVWDAQRRVDMTLSYDLPEKLYGSQITVYANANNLTDETDVRFGANGLVNQVESFGRSWLLGLRVNY